jgi:hypothetical protein
MELYVYVLTWCDDPCNLYGTTLTFKTLRDGFPTARVFVVDNASLSECRGSIRVAAEESGVVFTQLQTRIRHHEFIRDVIMRQRRGAAVFLDPDMCFWCNVENWTFDGLIGGRFIPRFQCEYTGCLTHPRLHTSFLWIPDVAALRKSLEGVRNTYFDFDAFGPYMVRLGGVWHRFDAGASLYAALQDQIHSFSEAELDAFDHLFCGTHYGQVGGSISSKFASAFKALHEYAKTDYTAIRGAWRLQDEYFQSLSVDDDQLLQRMVYSVAN